MYPKRMATLFGIGWSAERSAAASRQLSSHGNNFAFLRFTRSYRPCQTMQCHDDTLLPRRSSDARPGENVYMWSETTMSLEKRDPDCLMTQQVFIPQKPRPPARFLFWLAMLGYLALHAIPTLADDLQTAYQQAAATSPVIPRPVPSWMQNWPANRWSSLHCFRTSAREPVGALIRPTIRALAPSPSPRGIT